MHFHLYISNSHSYGWYRSTKILHPAHCSKNLGHLDFAKIPLFLSILHGVFVAKFAEMTIPLCFFSVFLYCKFVKGIIDVPVIFIGRVIEFLENVSTAVEELFQHVVPMGLHLNAGPAKPTTNDNLTHVYRYVLLKSRILTYSESSC